ncbi:MAG: hypothetical protein ACRCWG_10420 [Sarcina sp.]
MLQECIERLNSGILTIKDENVFVLGFDSIERLEDYRNNSINCFSSQGIYNFQNLQWFKIKDNALFILIKDNKEITKYHFDILYKDTIKFKNENKKMSSRVLKIRKCRFNNIYNLIVREKKIIDLKEIFIQKSYQFETKEDVSSYIFNNFKVSIINF